MRLPAIPVSPPEALIRKSLRGARFRAAVEKRGVAARRKPPRSRPFDLGVVDFFERCVIWVLAILEGTIAAGVVAADHAPSRVFATILIASMKRICMKECDVAGRHFCVDQVTAVHRGGDTFRVRPRLITGQDMIDAADFMRPAK